MTTKRTPATGPARITIRDVAELAGVSPSAVSHAFNGRVDISEPTRVRILAAADQLQWRPAAAASALVASRAQTVAFIVRRDPSRVRSDPFFVDVFAGMQSALSAARYSCLARIVSTRDEELDAYRHLSRRRQVDGFVLIDHEVDDPRYGIIRGAGLAAVAIGRAPEDCPFPVISSGADEAGVRAALETLSAGGHRRIAYVGGPEGFLYSAFRRERVQAAAANAGLDLIVRTGDYDEGSVSSLTRELLDGPQPPTAILYSSDWMAVWGMAEVQAAGLRVPEDVSVIGHDDAPFGMWATPPLATIHEDVAALADLAARTLIAAVLAEPPPGAAHPPTRFIARSSVGDRDASET